MGQLKVTRRNFLLTTFIIATVRSTGQSLAADGVIGHWILTNPNGSIIPDLSGNGNDGYLYNAQVVTDGIRFDRSGDLIVVRDNPTLEIVGDLTIEAFVTVTAYPPSSQGHALILFRGDERPGRDPYFLSLEPSGKARFHVESAYNNGYNFSFIMSDKPVALNTRLHIVGTLKDVSGEISLFINNILVAHDTTQNRPLADLGKDNNGALVIGGHPLNTNPRYKFPFHGIIHEVRLLSRAMTIGEIQERWLADKDSQGK